MRETNNRDMDEIERSLRAENEALRREVYSLRAEIGRLKAELVIAESALDTVRHDGLDDTQFIQATNKWILEGNND